MALSRRALLAQATAAATVATSSVTAAAAAAEPTTTTTTLRGTIPPGAPDFVYVPLDVPLGVRELRVSYRYDKPPTPPGTPGNALDIGLFDQRGTALGRRGFRGWSGGTRSEFFVRADDATPGYLPGPLEPGRRHVALGPYTVAPQGLPYEITAVLTFGEPASPAPVTYPPERVPGRGRAWYRGDCHVHSVHSDGRRTPTEIAGLARAAGLDFINTSEHNTHSSHTAWAGACDQGLLVLTGEEVTTRTGHVLTGAEGCDLRLVTDQGLAFTAPGATSLEWRTTPARAAYVRAEARRPAQMPPLPGPPAAFTNPIWLDS
ncbi:hypothetical protein OG625_33360 [Streptomyces sp. NBC_01351]|nr:hypothetical protein [Streptomyces sp. NBC_01351]